MSPPPKLTAKEIYKNTVFNTATVFTEKGLGSGFFIDSNKIVTNYHVIAGVKNAEIILNNSDKKYPVVGYLGIDLVNDLILLQVACNNKNFISIESEIPQPGEKVFAIGSPIGLPKTISEGIISGIRNFNDKKLLQITAPISHGSSGCPILNESGKLVGVAVSGITEASNIGFCIPSSFVKTLVDFKESYSKNLTTLNYDSKYPEDTTQKHNPSSEKNEIASNESLINKRYLGKHLFNVYFINGFESFGSATIEMKNGHYIISGSQSNKKEDSWAKIQGRIEIIDINNFIFHGTFKIHNPPFYEIDKKYNSSASPDCEWTGSTQFELMAPDRSYWRLRGDNGCYSLTGDVDIFFKR